MNREECVVYYMVCLLCTALAHCWVLWRWCACCVLCDGVTVVYYVMVWLLCTVWWCDSCVLCDGVKTVVYCVMVWLLCTITWWCDCCVLLMVWLLCTVWWCDSCVRVWWCTCCVLCDGVTVVYMWWCDCCVLCWWCDKGVLCDGVPVVYSMSTLHLQPISQPQVMLPPRRLQTCPDEPSDVQLTGGASAHSTVLTKTSPPSLSSLIISVLGQPLPSMH